MKVNGDSWSELYEEYEYEPGNVGEKELFDIYNDELDKYELYDEMLTVGNTNTWQDNK